LLGTFHFDDPGRDDDRQRVHVGVMSPEPERQIQALLDRLARYRPTKIAVEWSADRQAPSDSAYAAHRAGRLVLPANEIHQLGFRFAARLGHSEVFAIDAPARWYDTSVSTDVLIDRARSHGQSDLLQRGQAWDRYFTRLNEYEDSLKTQVPLAQYFAYLNRPERLRENLGRYLVGEMEVGGGDDHIGADMRAAWHDRNLRIFSNILRLSSEPDERILVIIGAGHVPLPATSSRQCA
jgi:hypothetical protein